MHNVNILTIHKEPNYGAVLQAYALYKTIENLGHVPYIINLDMDYRRFPYSLKYRVLLGLHKWMKGYSHCFALAERFSHKYCPNQGGNFHSLDGSRLFKILIFILQLSWSPTRGIRATII